jgi:hypothetical protein
MTLLKNKKSPSIVAIVSAIVVGGTLWLVQPATAASPVLPVIGSSAGSSGYGPYPPRIALPVGKDELSVSDVRHAVKQHLIRIRATNRWVGDVHKTKNAMIIVKIVDRNKREVGEFGVDAFTAEIYPHDLLMQAQVGNGKDGGCGEYRAAGLLMDGSISREVAATTPESDGYETASGPSERDEMTPNEYRRMLRAHMLGDGQPWAPWVTAARSTNACDNDYRNGGPDIPLTADKIF